MVRLVRVFIAIILVLTVVPISCSGGDADPNLTTYTTVEEKSSRIGSQGGEVELDDGAKASISEDTLDEDVMVTLSRRSVHGELPTRIEEDPDGRLISDFYFVETDMVLDRQRGVKLEIPYEPPGPSSQVRVIRVVNIGDATYVHFVESVVDEAAKMVRVSDVDWFPDRAAISEYEESFPPREGFGFHGMGISIGYAAVSDTDDSHSSLCACSVQAQKERSAIVCVIRWLQITCYGSRADVIVDRLYGTSDEMVDYASTALRYADSIQKAYTEAGFDTWDKITVVVSTLTLGSAGRTIPGSAGFFIKRGLDTRKGYDLNYVVNHETVHTMQSLSQPAWWMESSAQWIMYYFEPDTEARQQIGSDHVFSKAAAAGNPYREPFPWSGAEYDYDVLIDFAVEAGPWVAGDVVRLINANYTPYNELIHLYREQPHGFARHIGDSGSIIGELEHFHDPLHELDFSSPGTIELSVEVDPLTLPFMYLQPAASGLATFSVYLLESENQGGVVVYSFGPRYEGTRHRNPARVRVEPTSRLYFFPYAQGTEPSRLELRVEWWPNVEYDLTISSTEGGRVTSPGEGAFTYLAGEIERLVAEPDEGYQFINWTGDVETVSHLEEAVSTITVEGNHSIKANFQKAEATEYTLTVSSTDGGSVTSPGEGTFTYDAGAVVDLVAEASEGYRFVDWTGDVGTIGNVNVEATTITMDANYTIAASFDEQAAGEYSPMISAGFLHTVGLKSDGTVVAVGWNEYGQCDVGGWTDTVQVAAGSYHTVGLKSDGTVVAAGLNSRGQCDVAGWDDMVQVEASGWHTVGLQSDGRVVAVGQNNYGQCDVECWTDIVQIAAGSLHTVGLKSDGTVVAAGWNEYGQCDVGGWTDTVQVAAGDTHTVGIKSDGTVVAVGLNNDGRCDVGDWTGIEQVSAGGQHTAGLKTDGTVVTAGSNYHGQRNVGGWTDVSQVAAGGHHTVGLKSDGVVVAVGYSAFGQLNFSDWTDDIIEVAAGAQHTVGLKSDGRIVAAGDNDFGQCNFGDWMDITRIAAGSYHTVGLRSDGTVVAAGWNNHGQCNVGDWTDIVQVAAGWAHTVGLKGDGTVVTAGWNGYGQGNVGGWTDILQVAAGWAHTVGLKDDGTVVAVGWDGYGECDVEGWMGIGQVAAGRFYTVGLRSDGTVVAGGWNEYGQCDVSHWAGIVLVAVHWGHVVGLKSDATLVAAGWNEYGQCEVGDWTDIVQVAAGLGHTVGLKSDGTVLAEGLNDYGQCNFLEWNLGVPGS